VSSSLTEADGRGGAIVKLVVGEEVGTTRPTREARKCLTSRNRGKRRVLARIERHDLALVPDLVTLCPPFARHWHHPGVEFPAVTEVDIFPPR
jgi:hypothetical protein